MMKKRKMELIKVNLSNVFMVRTKCAYCGKKPTVYYYVGQQYLNTDHRFIIKESDRIHKWLDSMSSDWYLGSDPKDFDKVGFLDLNSISNLTTQNFIGLRKTL